jgi:RND superfamily putative drug exporter
VVARVAGWCVEHRRRAVVTWVVLLVAALGVSSAVATRRANDYALKGTESQRVEDLPQRHVPAQSGDVDQIVLHALQGRITDPATTPG